MAFKWAIFENAALERTGSRRDGVDTETRTSCRSAVELRRRDGGDVRYRSDDGADSSIGSVSTEIAWRDESDRHTGGLLGGAEDKATQETAP